MVKEPKSFGWHNAGHPSNAPFGYSLTFSSVGTSYVANTTDFRSVTCELFPMFRDGFLRRSVAIGCCMLRFRRYEKNTVRLAESLLRDLSSGSFFSFLFLTAHNATFMSLSAFARRRTDSSRCLIRKRATLGLPNECYQKPLSIHDAKQSLSQLGTFFGISLSQSMYWGAVMFELHNNLAYRRPTSRRIQ